MDVMKKQNRLFIELLWRHKPFTEATNVCDNHTVLVLFCFLNVHFLLLFSIMLRFSEQIISVERNKWKQLFILEAAN